jgi:hypothetical protein
LLAGRETLVCATVLGVADCDTVWVGIVVLLPMFKDALWLFEISTATIATTPMAAAPIPATRNVRDPPDPPPWGGGGIRWTSP